MTFHGEQAREGKTAQASIADFFNMADFPGKLNICPLRQRPEEPLALIDELDQRGMGFRALNLPMNTTTPTGQVFLQIQAAFAEMERNIIRQRVREGVKAARARRRKGGRSCIMTREKPRYACSLMTDRTRSIPEICRELGNLPTSTLYRTPTKRSRTRAGGFSMHEPASSSRIWARADQARSPAGIRYGRSLRCHDKSTAE